MKQKISRAQWHIEKAMADLCLSDKANDQAFCEALAMWLRLWDEGMCHTIKEEVKAIGLAMIKNPRFEPSLN